MRMCCFFRLGLVCLERPLKFKFLQFVLLHIRQVERRFQDLKTHELTISPLQIIILLNSLLILMLVTQNPLPHLTQYQADLYTAI